jgi:hypothetical protein
VNTTPAALPLSMPRAWHMINGEPTPVIKKIWMIDQPAQITFEVAEIDGIEANERGEQTPVSLKGLRVRLPEHHPATRRTTCCRFFPRHGPCGIRCSVRENSIKNGKDRFGEKLRLARRARENVYFAEQDRRLIEQLRERLRKLERERLPKAKRATGEHVKRDG